jgi:hypothetical protein
LTARTSPLGRSLTRPNTHPSLPHLFRGREGTTAGGKSAQRTLWSPCTETAVRPPSARVADAGLVTQVKVNRAGFIFEDSDVRYLSRAEFEKLPPEQLLSLAMRFLHVRDDSSKTLD